MKTTLSTLFSLSKPGYMAKTHSKRKGFPFIVEIIKFLILYYATMLLFPLLIGKLMGLFGVSLSPLAEMILQFIVLGVMGLLFMLYFRLIDRREIRYMGFVNARTLPKEALMGAAFGFCMFTLCVLAALLLGGAKFEGANQGTLALALIMLPCVIFQSFGEEVMFRGYLLVNSTARMPLWPAVILNGILFAAGHLGNPGGTSFFMVLNVTLVGILLSVLTIRRGSIWAACTLHGLWNYTQGFVYGLPISGQDSGSDTLLRFSLADGKPLVTGGTFGIESSLISTLVLVLAIVAVLFMTRKRAANDNAQS